MVASSLRHEIPEESAEGVAHYATRWLTDAGGEALNVNQLCLLDGLGVH